MYSKYELQNVISGNAKVRYGEIIQTIANFLREKKRAIQKSEESKFFKGEETEVLIQFINHHQLWIESIDESKYIGEGAEQKVYEHTDSNFVINLPF